MGIFNSQKVNVTTSYRPTNFITCILLRHSLTLTDIYPLSRTHSWHVVPSFIKLMTLVSSQIQAEYVTWNCGNFVSFWLVWSWDCEVGTKIRRTTTPTYDLRGHVQVNHSSDASINQQFNYSVLTACLKV